MELTKFTITLKNHIRIVAYIDEDQHHGHFRLLIGSSRMVAEYDEQPAEIQICDVKRGDDEW